MVLKKLFSRPEDCDGNTYRFLILSNSLYVLFFLVHFCFIPLFIVLDIPFLILFNLLSTPFYILVLWVNLRGHYFAALVGVTIEVIIHASAASYNIGEIGIRQALIFNLILVILWPGKLALKSLLAAVVSLSFVALNYFDHVTIPVHELHPYVFNGLRGSVAFLEAFIAGYIAFYYLRAANAVEDDLEDEISDRKAAEQKVADSESRIRAVMENVDDAIITITPNGLIESANKAVERVFGFKSADLIGENVRKLMPAAEAAEHDGYLEHYMRSGEKKIIGTGVREVRGLRNNGDEFPMDLTVGEVELGNTKLFVGAMRDVTERKEAEEQLTEAFSVITSSIQYASRIQRSVLPQEDSLSELFSDYFVLWQPRDVVGGDIYWNRTWGDGHLIILADCTGHGVPGAFMTLISTGALDRALDEIKPTKVGDLVQRIHQMVQVVLKQHEDFGESDDGLELGAVYIDPTKENLRFSGARFELFTVFDGAVTDVKGTKKGIGYKGIPFDQKYEETDIPVQDGFSFYLTSDGLLDQIGGEKRRMFGKKRFRLLLEEIHTLPMTEQKHRIESALAAYQGIESRRDDVSVIGFSFT